MSNDSSNNFRQRISKGPSSETLNKARTRNDEQLYHKIVRNSDITEHICVSTENDWKRGKPLKTGSPASLSCGIQGGPLNVS